MSRLIRLVIAATMGVSAIPVIAMAQGTTAVVNPVYRRAQTLVNDGNAVAGRALVDSMISAATQGTNEYAEGVYWRAVLAANAADAEMDYRRIVVDYPQSPRVEDALIRLAQLEIARANYDAAVRHLNTLITEHPQSQSRGRAGYWMARALFDKNDVQGGCIATADALSRTSEDDAELRNQITYLNQRCAGVALTRPAATTSSSTSAPTSVPASVPTSVAPVSPPTAPPALPPAAPPVVAPVETQPSTPVPAKKAAPVVADSTPRTPKPTSRKPVVPKVEPVAPSPAPKGESAGSVYSVQIAAYNGKPEAVAMVAKLKKRGYEARVDGEKAPFRVRIGKYATAAQASAVQRSLKAKQITGFVVQADIQ